MWLAPPQNEVSDIGSYPARPVRGGEARPHDLAILHELHEALAVHLLAFFPRGEDREVPFGLSCLWEEGKTKALGPTMLVFDTTNLGKWHMHVSRNRQNEANRSTGSLYNNVTAATDRGGRIPYRD